MRKKFLALSLAVIVSAAQVMTVSASKQEQLQQQRQLVVQHHFPQFPVGVITEKTNVNGT